MFSRRASLLLIALFLVFGLQLQAQFPPVIYLDSLDGNNGFVIRGVDVDDGPGWAVAGAGDINGDGLGDLIVGASRARVNGKWGAGITYLLYGRFSYPPVWDLAHLAVSQGIALQGLADFDSCGYSVTGLGDVNGDGRDDVLFGASGVDVNSIFSDAGEVYLMYGRDSNFASAPLLDQLDPREGVTFQGQEVIATAGHDVSGIGDLNGDGLNDMIIGSLMANKAWVVFGDSGGFDPRVNLDGLRPGEGFIIQGTNNGDMAGRAVSGAGDVNGDGIHDLIIGAPMARTGSQFTGACYVIFGKTTPFDSLLNLGTLDSSQGFVLLGENPGDMAGHAVSGGGDVNGDGFSDLIIGAPYRRGNSGYGTGAVYIVYGQGTGFPQSFLLSSLDGMSGYRVEGLHRGDLLGWSVSASGDVNADGLTDVLLGAPEADPNGKNTAGTSYLIFGRKAGIGATFDLAMLNGRNGFSLEGSIAEGYSGWSVNNSVDIFGDGTHDLIIGAPLADAKGQLAVGETYVIFGLPTKTSLDFLPHVSEFSLFPNPAEQEVYLNAALFAQAQRIDIEMYDQMGREVLLLAREKTDAGFRLSIPVLPSGLYFLRIRVDGMAAIRKLLIRER